MDKPKTTKSKVLLQNSGKPKKRVDVNLMSALFSYRRKSKMKRKWTKESAERYIKTAKEKGLKYWSAKDFLRNHRTMHSTI